VTATPASIAADALPIPADVSVGPGWTEQMQEMADHIGAFDTLQLVARFGGQRIWMPKDVKISPFADFLGDDAIATLAHVYGGNWYWVPVGRTALARARRAPVLAAVRAREMTGAAAAKLLGTSRTYLAHLVNATDEGSDAAPLRLPRAGADPRQLRLFSDS